MVSLDTTQRQREGASSFENRFFYENDDSNIETTPLIDDTEQSYRSIRTTWLIIFHILLSIVLLTVIVLLPTLVFHDQCQNQTQPYSQKLTGYDVALYVHASSYLISVVFDRFYRHYQDRSRRDGYLQFYRKTRNLRRTPLFIISTGNAILVCLIKFLEEKTLSINDRTFCPWYFLAILTGAEVLLILIVLIRYLILTIRFNRKRARPDATEHSNLSNFITTQMTTNEIGFRDGSYHENDLEQQADLIRYLQERNIYLSRLLLQCKRQLENERQSQH